MFISIRFIVVYPTEQNEGEKKIIMYNKTRNNSLDRFKSISVGFNVWPSVFPFRTLPLISSLRHDITTRVMSACLFPSAQTTPEDPRVRFSYILCYTYLLLRRCSPLPPSSRYYPARRTTWLKIIIITIITTTIMNYHRKPEKYNQLWTR